MPIEKDMTGGSGSSSLSKSEARCSTVPSPCEVMREGGGQHDGRQRILVTLKE